MPLQNRVTPSGDIVALAGRGTLTGNRGIIHNADKQIVRQWQVKRWIACALEFRGRKREVLQPNRWTHLFFLDEATAFSAGHRPCAECRNADYKRFRALWESVYGATSGADEIDAVLHANRVDTHRKRTYHAPIDALPDGSGLADFCFEGANAADAVFVEDVDHPTKGDVDAFRCSEGFRVG